MCGGRVARIDAADHSALSLPWCTVTVAFAARFVGSDFGHVTFTVFSPCAGTSALSGAVTAGLPMTSEPVTGAALLPMFAIVTWMTRVLWSRPTVTDATFNSARTGASTLMRTPTVAASPSSARSFCVGGCSWATRG